MKALPLAAVILALVVPAVAQQPLPPDPAFLQKALETVVGQRNTAMDQLAVAQVNLSRAQEDLSKAKARIEELEKKYEPKTSEK